VLDLVTSPLAECIRSQSTLQCIKENKKIQYGEKRFSIWRMELLHPAMWHDQVTAPYNVARALES